MEEEDHEHEANPNPTLLNLPLFSIMPSPEHPSGMLTPPLYSSASVPFRWEEQPGKPRPCTSLIPFPSATTTQEDSPNKPKGLELPPCRLFLDHPTKTPSPTTVLEGPYVLGSKPKFTSFRFSKERQRQASFDSIDDDSQRSTSPDLEAGHFSNKSKLPHKGKGGIFGSWRYNLRTPKASSRPGKIGEIGGSSRSFIHPDFESDETNISKNKVSRMRRNGSFSSSLTQARSHFWAAVYEGIKQVMPWKSRKSKKGLV
ncbi:OLC1v1038367C1 [Oldenlandia corymbosa var. corymbosa]|uniref:OLC1v1038367C1 n=1 Tax=Oldenlandia corymbosa var. corymbosa TaxID=529605 RepID=A0AAV1D2P4_OLDCO|nr:OLC1v1038367C1 [Oldenlandia corymbosa var. corymbosa]